MRSLKWVFGVLGVICFWLGNVSLVIHLVAAIIMTATASSGGAGFNFRWLGWEWLIFGTGGLYVSAVVFFILGGLCALFIPEPKRKSPFDTPFFNRPLR